MATKLEPDYKTRIEIQIQTLVKGLISSMTDFDENDENFTIAFEYIISNIKNHRFLTVDKFRVKRELNGLQEKFEIHLQKNKSEKLQKLVDKFMEKKLKPHVPDIHYSILQFLLLMSNNPISSHQEGDDFDKKYQANKEKLQTQQSFQESMKAADLKFQIQNNQILEMQKALLQKYDEDYVFESSSEESELDEEEQDENEQEEIENVSGLNKEDKTKYFNKNSNIFEQKKFDVFSNENQSTKKQGIIKNISSLSNADKSVDQSKIVSFRNANDSGIHRQKDSLLQVTNLNQNDTYDQVKQQNDNASSVYLRGIQTNQSFWNITQQSILKKSSLQKRSYEEFLSEQKKEEEKQLFLAARQFTKNDLFKDPNSLAQIYENYIKENLSRTVNTQISSNGDSQIQLNHWIYQNKTERQIIQDIILMLQNQPSQTFVLVDEQPPQFKLKKKIQVNHLTPSTLENMIDCCIDFANQLLKFQFYREQYDKLEIGTTFQAFLASIQAFYQQFQQFLNAFHLVFLHQSAQIKRNEIQVTLEEKYKFMLDKTVSLIELFKGLREYQMEMRMMMNTLEGAIEIFKKQNLKEQNTEMIDESNANQHEDNKNVQSYIACQVIDFLYFQLQINSQHYCQYSHLQQLNCQLFILSIEPYLSILNDWLHGGFFYDKYSEFFIKNNIRNQNQQQTQQIYQHIDHQINWVKDFSIRLYQVEQSQNKSATPQFLQKFEQTILQIGKNVRLIGYILNEHDQRVFVEQKLKIEDIREQIKNQISEAIERIDKSQQNSVDICNEILKNNQQQPEKQNVLDIESAQNKNQITLQQNNTHQQDKTKDQPKQILKNLSISSILKQKNQFKQQKERDIFQLKEQTHNFDKNSLHQSIIVDENQMQEELDNSKIKDNPFNIFTMNHSEIFNQSVFTIQDSFLNQVIPELKQINTNVVQKNEKVNLNKKINQLLDKKGFTSQFMRLFDLSIEFSINQMDRQVKKYLGSILMNDFKLLEHFQALRHIYFMENGFISTEFLNYLFDNLETYDTLKNSSSLKNYFKELITNSNQPFIRNLSEYFSIEVLHDPVNTYLKNLKIKFDAPYPLDAIFDQDSIFLYNHIYQFLLLLKKSQHFLLDKNYYLKKMRFFDDSRMKNKLNLSQKKQKNLKSQKNIYSDSDDDEIYRGNSQMDEEVDLEEQARLNKEIKNIKWKMCLLQKQFLNFTNSFQYSTFVIIIQEITQQFLNEVSQEYNIASFIDMHKQYLKKIADLCFLSKKTENIFPIISSLLKYCCDFHALIQRLEATETLDLYTMKGELQRIKSDFASLKQNFDRHNILIISFLQKYGDIGLKQEWVPLNTALDFNNFYVKEDERKNLFDKNF
ncbi:Spc97/Spc98 family protein (macronuclear) [Tetrahymena thermophila SB210]|uniref:Spc97/Spc98 family protein n=1 Tax=Tetrahymena thermophila (strain SB210) TaxID=312017 RepID=I7M7M6_TETTS|nr:Spc97/Spc98 family protein [Tetrahymena thermophila SB210]EAR94232.2 Spc97/Spc98 family protein [Tetrahymena thermophila SB210]|eukprot:XP_001014477.2 Spc97/Spc98 family protein [Tetrahymena thermophila SB210]